MVAFINEYSVLDEGEPICAFLPIAPSTYYRHKQRKTDPSTIPPVLFAIRCCLSIFGGSGRRIFGFTEPVRCGDSLIGKG